MASTLVRYAPVVPVVAVAVAAEALLRQTCGMDLPLLLLWPAVLIAAWHGGFGPGVLATCLSALAADYLFFVPGHLFAFGSLSEFVSLLLFSSLGILFSWLSARVKIAREKAEQYARQLRAADEQKTAFLHTLGHELRGPLGTLRTSVAVLRQQPDVNKSLTPIRDIMHRQLEHIISLVEELLDLARSEVGKVLLRRERLELAGIIAQACEVVEPVIESQGHDFTVALTPEPTYLIADRTRLVQVFANLLTNAAKYTPAGGRIVLTAHQAGPLVEVRVEDNGSGIPPEMLPHIFELYTQVELARHRSQGGLGIGLALVRKLVELHGGSVAAHSAGVGRGSTFVVRLPRAAAETPVLQSAESVAAGVPERG
jgi:signal transduction histidine kinase